MRTCTVWLPDYIDEYIEALPGYLGRQFDPLFLRLEAELAPRSPTYTSPSGDIRILPARNVWVQYVYRNGDVLVTRAGLGPRVLFILPFLKNSDVIRAKRLRA